MGSPGFLTNPMFNMGFLLVAMQLAKKVDWEDPNVLTYARIGYYSAQALVVAMAYALITLIKKKNDTTVLTYNAPTKPSLSAPESTGPQTVTTTVRDYDVDQVQQFIRSSVTSIFIISLMHFQFKFTQPLLMQSILPIKNLLTHKEALIHLWGDAPEGSLARPFTADSPFGGLANLLGGGSDNTAAPTAASGEANSTEHRHQD
ncbi:inorganic phosphate transporter Pho88 [Blakeslea trispora]|nr:inorganic phosphate transporter Pho88 [Blakeslea trispora]